MTQLPPLPRPWDIDELCARLARQRFRPLLLHPMNLPGLPLGLWFDDGKRDHIVYRQEVSGYYRDHILLHEICHMLAGHNILDHSASLGEHDGDTVPGTVEHALLRSYTDAQEEIAEMFAAKVLKLAKRARQRPQSDFEQRAATMLGAAN